MIMRGDVCMDAVVTAINTWIGETVTSLTGLVTGNVPVLLGLTGVILAIGFGRTFIKKFGKG